MQNIKQFFKIGVITSIILLFVFLYITGNCLKFPIFIITLLDNLVIFFKTLLLLIFKTQYGSILILVLLFIYIFYTFLNDEEESSTSDIDKNKKTKQKTLFFIINFFLLINPFPSKKFSLKIYNKFFQVPVFKKITNEMVISIYENRATLLYALYIAIFIRSLFFQPFYIPSSSMEPGLVVGDRLFVSKYSYGYSKHSFPFSPPVIKNRLFSNTPKRGDVVVFKTPSDNRTDYIKRLIGLPGDKIQFINGDLFINNNQILKSIVSKTDIIYCGQKIDANTYEEKLSNGKKYKSAYSKNGTYKNSDIFIVPDKHYFFLGDNRDCSKDSRYLSSVGYVNENNLVGKARFIFFSSDTMNRPIFNFWKCVDKSSLRSDRFFKKII